MEDQHIPNEQLADAYAAAVDLERDAWQALHSHAPGTPERLRAWKAWSEAISHTNEAWRALSAQRFTAGRMAPHASTQSHAGA